METKYILIINGYEQKCIYPEEELQTTLAIIKSWKNDGRLKPTDKVEIKTVIEYCEEVSYDTL